MPPIMGAAAFVMAELLGISYLTVVTHAFLPAVISYIALFYISHLEALKLDIKGLPERNTTFRKNIFRWNSLFNTYYCFNLSSLR